MTPRRFIASVFDEAGRLGMPMWQKFLATLALAVLSVLGREAWNALRRIEWQEAPPQHFGDGPPPVDPPSQFGDNVTPNDDPDLATRNGA